jgi:hypothetical protein
MIMRTRGRSATAVLTSGTTLNGIELGQVVDVLGTQIIAGAELALLLRRQAVHPPPGDGPRGKRTRRVIKMRPARARLTAAPTLREPHRVDVHPASTCRSQFDPDRQPVCFCHITQTAENRQASRQILCVHSEIKIAVLSGDADHYQVLLAVAVPTGPDFPAGGGVPSAGGSPHRRQISRWTGISRGTSLRPGMNGTASSSRVARPVM